jgi:peptidoglycan-associated lipoprotein
MAEPIEERAEPTETPDTGLVEGRGQIQELMDIGLGRIHFDTDKWRIREDAREVLKRNAELLQSYPEVKIIVEGHCDERNTVEYNLALGERRAAATKDYLIKLGLDDSRISTISYGEERPIDYGHDETAWKKNRRAEFTIVE